MDKINNVDKIKCVIWDLDNTIWNGILLESEIVELREGVLEIIKTLDDRGILQSIASKNEYDFAMEKLNEFNIAEYFIYPKINWDKKSTSVIQIASAINIGLDTIAFIDDQTYEREEVKFTIPEILCLDPENMNGLLDMAEFNPTVITNESKLRRKIYQSDIIRNNAQNRFEGSGEEFLRTLSMELSIKKADLEDLERARELTIRTNQLNATGYTYSMEELVEFTTSVNHKLWIAKLQDKYGDYGNIGVILLECNEKSWTLKLLLMSCRIMSRGIGSTLLNFIINQSIKNNVLLRAEFVPTEKNRMMYVTYKFSGFMEKKKRNHVVILENTEKTLHSMPEYIKINYSEL